MTRRVKTLGVVLPSASVNIPTNSTSLSTNGWFVNIAQSADTMVAALPNSFP